MHLQFAHSLRALLIRRNPVRHALSGACQSATQFFRCTGHLSFQEFVVPQMQVEGASRCLQHALSLACISAASRLRWQRGLRKTSIVTDPMAFSREEHGAL